MTVSHKLFLVFLILFGAQASLAQDDDFVFYSDLSRDWYQGGDYFEWTSTTEDNNAKKVNVFYKTWGDETKPKLVLIHGFPNSSFDYYKMIPFLEDEYHIAALDFPGSGFSDKPLDGYNYMLAENAEIVDYFVREVVEFEDFALYTHDRGVSIGLAFLGNYLVLVRKLRFLMDLSFSDTFRFAGIGPGRGGFSLIRQRFASFSA